MRRICFCSCRTRTCLRAASSHRRASNRFTHTGCFIRSQSLRRIRTTRLACRLRRRQPSAWRRRRPNCLRPHSRLHARRCTRTRARAFPSSRACMRALQNTSTAPSRPNFPQHRRRTRQCDRGRGTYSSAGCLDDVSRLDNSYHSLLLNHVARRASKAQGIALLTLYAKAFAKPIDLERQPFDGSRIGQRHAAPPQASDPHASTQRAEERRIELAAQLVDRLKMDVRRSSAQAPGSAQLGPQGHLPICWGVFAACLGISLRKSLYLHLFLQARALFSSSIRLNTLGPYLAHQIMRFHMRTVVNDIIQEMDDAGCMVISPIQRQARRCSHYPRERWRQVRI